MLIGARTGIFGVKAKGNLPYDDELDYIIFDPSIYNEEDDAGKIANSFYDADLQTKWFSYNGTIKDIRISNEIEIFLDHKTTKTGVSLYLTRQWLTRGGSTLSSSTYNLLGDGSGSYSSDADNRYPIKWTAFSDSPEIEYTKNEWMKLKWVKDTDDELKCYQNGILKHVHTYSGSYFTTPYEYKPMTSYGVGPSTASFNFDNSYILSTGIKIGIKSLKHNDNVHLIPVIKNGIVGLYNKVDGEIIFCNSKKYIPVFK